MYYHTPKVNKYVTYVQKYRLAIILSYAFVTLLALFFYRPEFVSSDSSFWLNESKEMQRTQAQAYDTKYIGRLELHIGQFDETVKMTLNRFQSQLESINGVSHVDSLCGAYRIYSDGDSQDSSLVKATPLGHMDAKELQKFVKAYGREYDSFVNSDFTKVSYFIYSNERIDISAVEVPFPYSYSEPSVKADLHDYIYSVLAVIASIVLFFRLVFHNYISAIAGLFVIALTMVATFTLIFLITGDDHVHIAMTLIVLSIALIDYLYFYYRWHVSQHRADVSRAMLKTINRNIHPAFWTSLITLIGLGPLLLVDSAIVQQLSLSVILASLFAYLLNLTLLPALVSYFKVQHPRVEFARYCYVFANKEIHYNKTFLKLFLAVSTFIMLIGAYQLFFAQQQMFANNVDRDVITVSLPYEEVDETLLMKISDFESALKEENPG
ncbi:MAG: MMPL family transporter, partial [Sulfurimonadaceae bacterium]